MAFVDNNLVVNGKSVGTLGIHKEYDGVVFLGRNGAVPLGFIILS